MGSSPLIRDRTLVPCIGSACLSHWTTREVPSPLFNWSIVASQVAQRVKNPPAMQETWVQSLGWEDSPGGGHGNPLQDSCLENPHGKKSLVGYSSWGSQSQTRLKRISSSSRLGLQRPPIKFPMLYSRLSLEYNCIFGDVCLATNLQDVQRLTISSGKSVQASLAYHRPHLAVHSRC